MAQCKADIENAQRQTNSVLEDMNKVIDEFLDDLPLDYLDNSTIKNLYDSMHQSVGGAKKALAKFRHDNGIKLERTRLSRQEAHELIHTNRLRPAMEKSWTDLKSINPKYTGNIDQLFRDFMPSENLSHQQRLESINYIQDKFPGEIQKVIDTYAPSKKDLEKIRQAEFEMNGALDIAAMYARNPYEDAVSLSPEFLAATESFNNSVDRKVIQQQFVDDGVQNAIKNQVGSLTESMATKMLKSQVPGAQMFALNILETPSGFAGDIVRPNTASIRSSMLHKKSIHEVNMAYSNLLDEVGKAEGWSQAKRYMLQDGHASTHPEIAKLNQDVMLHINNQKLGRPSDAPAHVKEYARIQTEAYHKIHEAGVGKVEGITANNKINHYDQQHWKDSDIMQLANNPKNKDEVTELFRRGLMGGGMDEDLASMVAAAVIQKKMNSAHRPGLKSQPHLGEADIPGLMPRLQEVVEGMEANNVRPQDVQRFIDAFQAGVDDMQPGYANRRMNLDIAAEHTIDGKKVRLIDLLDQDSPGNFDRYSKEANGRIAIAEAMPQLNSDHAINDYLFNTGKQAQLMGTSVDTKAMRNSINIMLGMQPEGSLPMDVRKIRDLVSLAGMGGLGESQLAETGMAMNRGISGLIGTAQMLSGRKGKRGQSRGVEITPEQAGNAKFLGELEELTGLFQESHRVVRRNVHYDQHDSDLGALSKIIDMGTGGKHRNNLKAAQDRFTGYAAIRSMQDQLAMSGMIQDISKAMKGDNPFTSNKRFKDIGIDVDNPNNVFFKNIREYADLDANGNITALNIHKWSPYDRDAAGIVLNRHAGQVVQAGYVGEMSPLMDNPWVNFMMQFRSYPLLAAEKQQARNLKFADKEAATGLFLNAVSSSGARIVRYSSLAAAQPLGEREDYFNRRMEGLAGDTWAYMGNAGMTPAIGSFANQILGNGDGPSNVGDMVPAMSYMNKMLGAHNSVTNGEPMNDNDYARLQSLIPLGTIGFVNIMAGMFRTGLDQ